MPRNTPGTRRVPSHLTNWQLCIARIRRSPAYHKQAGDGGARGAARRFWFPITLRGTTGGLVGPCRGPIEIPYRLWLSTARCPHPQSRAIETSAPRPATGMPVSASVRSKRGYGLHVCLFVREQATSRLNARDGHAHGNGAGGVPCDDDGRRDSNRPERPPPGHSEHRVRR